MIILPVVVICVAQYSFAPTFCIYGIIGKYITYPLHVYVIVPTLHKAHIF